MGRQPLGAPGRLATDRTFVKANPVVRCHVRAQFSDRAEGDVRRILEPDTTLAPIQLCLAVLWVRGREPIEKCGIGVHARVMKRHMSRLLTMGPGRDEVARAKDCV